MMKKDLKHKIGKLINKKMIFINKYLIKNPY